MRPADDASADAPGTGRSVAGWRQTGPGQPSPRSRQHVELKRDRTPLPPRPPHLPSLLPRTLTPGRSASAALQFEGQRSRL